MNDSPGSAATDAAAAPASTPASDSVSDPKSFAEMGLRPEVLRALTEMGFTQPMEVQRAAYAPLMGGRDVIVQSRTGSGKTAAFAIPFAQGLLDPSRAVVQALVLCPTRELALQVAGECERIGQHVGLGVVAIYGGAPMGKQVDGLRAGAQIVAGTPGRVLDHLRRGTLKLDRLRVLVLDEADEMLSMGFYEEISEIIKQCPAERQTLLFSATMPTEIERIAQRHMRTPENLQLSRDFVGVAEITHAYYMVSGMGRTRELLRILGIEKPVAAIIFCNTREETSLVAEQLRRAGLDAEAISSDLTQRDRERVMARCKAGDLHYLVATDIAARGIDISDLSHVINYTFPESAEVYVHRTGRTGRAGKSGVAISLISPRELGNFYYLKLTYKIRPQERTLPVEEELQPGRDDKRWEHLVGGLDPRPPTAESISLARRLLKSADETIIGRLVERQLAPTPSPEGQRDAPRNREPRQEAKPPPARPAPSTPRGHAPRAERAPAPSDPARTSDATPGAAVSDAAAAEATPRERDRNAPPEEGGRRRRRRRDRGGDRPDRGDRGGRPAERPRDASPPRERGNSAAPMRSEPPKKVPLPGSPYIEPTEGREFWEAWVDDHQNARPEAPAADATSDSVVPVAAAPVAAASAPALPVAESGPRASRLYVNIGRRDRTEAAQLEAWIRELGLGFERLELHNSHSYLFVDEGAVEPTIAALNGLLYGERPVACERARRS